VAAGDRAAGFTLIELLVVVAILAILSVLTVQVAWDAIAVARRTRCISNLHQIGLGMFMYGEDHNHRKPALPYSWTTPNVKEYGKMVGLGLLIDGYISTHEILLCPGIDPASDNNSDREMWRQSSLVGSSYLYEYYHPYSQYGDTTDAAELFRRTTSLIEDPLTDAMVMDLNFDVWPTIQGPVRCHQRLEVSNVLFKDGSASTHSIHEGLIAPNFKTFNVWVLWENAHALRAK
jgi:prepilin-type N-terminal cleavage/methylation domain-containing protein